MTKSDEYQFVFEKENENLLAMIFFGSQWNFVPVGRYFFNFIPIPEGGIRVSCDAVVVTNPGTGFVQTTNLDDRISNRGKLTRLYMIKGKIEGRDPEELMRADGITPDGKEPEKPIRMSSEMELDGNTIISAKEGGLADEAGLKPGDIIIEINARATESDIKKQIDDILLAGRRAIIAFERDGEIDILSIIPTPINQ